ncbi:CHC2 zinc finger domain-containing protein [Patescibacteria group bacterium]
MENIISLYIKIPENCRRNIVCPFKDHKDKSPSFKIYKNQNIFICF